jgi:hypothetical protein
MRGRGLKELCNARGVESRFDADVDVQVSREWGEKRGD